MPVRFLSDAELARLSGWPDELADDDLVTFFTLTSDDLGWLRSNVRAENRLGAAVQLCALPWLGWIPDDLSGCTSAVGLVAAILGLAAPAQAADAPRVLASATHIPTGIDHHVWLDEIGPHVNVPQVDTSVRANPSAH